MNNDKIEFDVHMAEVYGIHKAIIYSVIVKELEAAKLLNSNFFDGRYWVRKPLDDLYAQLPFITPYKIRILLSQMVSDNLLLSRCFNEDSFDRTRWFSLPDERKEIA